MKRQIKIALLSLCMLFLLLPLLGTSANAATATVEWGDYAGIPCWIGDTDATLSRTISVSGAAITDVTHVGISIYDGALNTLIAYKEEVPLTDGGVINMYYYCNAELGLVLQMNTQYHFQCHAKIGGVTFYSPLYYFITGPSQGYPVYFNSNGGNLVTSPMIVQPNGAKYPALPEPERSGYRFLGWFTDITGGTQVMQGDVAHLTTGCTLYAHWEKTLKITQQPKSVAAVSGASAKVTVKAQGDGLTYKWYYAEKGSSTFKLTTAFKGSSYTVTMNDERNGRRVYCVITDQYGNSVRSNTVTLSKKTPLKITTQPKSVTALSGASAKTTVKAQGDGLTYKWYYAEKGSSTFKLTTAFKGSSYTVTMTSARDGRRVYCVVTDKYGDSARSNTVTLTCKKEVKITGQSVTYAVKGGTAKAVLKVRGEGLTYTWYFAEKGSTTFQKTTAFSTRAYSITMNDARDGRRVYCVIRDKYGNTVKSRVMTLGML